MSENDEAWIEAEPCEPCIELCNEQGIEYEFNMTWIDGVWHCDHCGKPN